MEDADIEVTLSGGEKPGDFWHFQPGSEISGKVRIVPWKNINSRRVLVRLQWHTEGRGTQANGKVDEVVLAQGKLMDGVALSGDFFFTLPLEPWSYAGHYITIIWEVLVIIDIQLASDLVHNERFVMAPSR
jgi:hypothetical protein